jgi:hypothetical protein
MAIQTTLFGKIISLSLLSQLLTAYIGQKIGFNGPADALESPPKISVS